MKDYDEELQEVQEKIAGLPPEEQVEYRTGLVNNMLERLTTTGAINIKQITNGEYSFGDYEYNVLVMLSVIVTLLEEHYPGSCYIMNLNNDFMALVVETPLGNYINYMPMRIRKAFPVEERELNEEIIKQNEEYSVDILFSLLESDEEEG